MNVKSLIREEDFIKQLGINRVTAWRWRRAGKLRYYKIGKRILYSTQQLQHFLTAAEVDASQSPAAELDAFQSS
jgi:predicted site-specific integrase-resolvase